MLVLKSKRVEGFVCSDHAKRGSHMKIEAPSGKVVLVLVMLDEPPDINSAVTHAEIARRLESKHGLVSKLERPGGIVDIAPFAPGGMAQWLHACETSAFGMPQWVYDPSNHLPILAKFADGKHSVQFDETGVCGVAWGPRGSVMVGTAEELRSVLGTLARERHGG